MKRSFKFAEAQAQVEPDKYNADLVLQILWRKLADRFTANGWTIGELCDLLIADREE